MTNQGNRIEMSEKQERLRVIRGASIGALGGAALSEYLRIKMGFELDITSVLTDIVAAAGGAATGITLDYALGATQASRGNEQTTGLDTPNPDTLR